MKFKVGDRVKVKSYPDICKIGGECDSSIGGIPSIYPYNRYYFTDEMKNFVRKSIKLDIFFLKQKHIIYLQ